MRSIPVDHLQDKTNTGLQVKAFKAYDESPNDQNYDVHRDDHYIFFVLKKGSGILKVNFQDVEVTAGNIYYVLPSQIHTRVKANHAEGWFLAVDPALIAADLRSVFESRLDLQFPCKISEYDLNQYDKLLSLLHTELIQRKRDQYYLAIIHSLAQTFLGMAASNYHDLDMIENKHRRSAEIVRNFKNLLSTNIKKLKKASDYAAMLNISAGHLNEVIKGITGSTVSFWIQQEVFNEAKRLLYHGNSDVKEIAYELGFDDYNYFIRSFRKVCGLSPLKFRSLNRK
jgi:AraC family transcriptional activator of pobA